MNEQQNQACLHMIYRSNNLLTAKKVRDRPIFLSPSHHTPTTSTTAPAFAGFSLHLIYGCSMQHPFQLMMRHNTSETCYSWLWIMLSSFDIDIKLAKSFKVQIQNESKWRRKHKSRVFMWSDAQSSPRAFVCASKVSHWKATCNA